MRYRACSSRALGLRGEPNQHQPACRHWPTACDAIPSPHRSGRRGMGQRWQHWQRWQRWHRSVLAISPRVPPPRHQPYRRERRKRKTYTLYSATATHPAAARANARINVHTLLPSPGCWAAPSGPAPVPAAKGPFQCLRGGRANCSCSRGRCCGARGASHGCREASQCCAWRCGVPRRRSRRVRLRGVAGIAHGCVVVCVLLCVCAFLHAPCVGACAQAVQGC